MKSSEIRHLFVEYFKKNGHTAVASSSLIPENDPTILFANAGMNQFKNTFLGLEPRDYVKAVSVQKCVRAGGKHNDLDNVGFTARHHTFFEMLGNFSFGDYFKKEAIHFAWEFLTVELKIPKEKLYVTVFETDDEAADIWHKQEGIPLDRIFRFGEKDNFWRMGDTGPCGPCTEIFYDHGPDAGTIADPYEGIKAGEDRFVEIWNLVFMQYFENPPGKLTPLPKPSVDTGSGFERVVAALQGKFSNYDTDLFHPMIETACKIAGVKYITDKNTLTQDKLIWETTTALRVLADHCRSCSFLIADGALPSNEGRGYVLRRIIRRAIRFGRKISPNKSLFPAMAESLIATFSATYPDLKARESIILSTLRDEEQRFLTTLDQGTQILNEEINKLKSAGGKILSGEIVFKLYDTYGFPVDLTNLMSAEQNLSIDETEFENQMNLAREKAKSSWKGKGTNSDEAHLISAAQNVFKSHHATDFIGYDTTNLENAKILFMSNGQKEVNELKAGDEGFVIFKTTPFYAEGGGQVGDSGEMTHVQGFKATILNTTKQNDLHIHFVSIQSGQLKKTDSVQLQVHSSHRRNTIAHHSATHLMHAALRKVLGNHVSQAGSLVDPQKLRFDFTHNKPLTLAEITEIEKLVNEQISLSVEVKAEKMKHKEALDKGAMALFGEKYGEEVRVLTMGGFSCELCGGVHVKNTSQIRVFKIVSESGVSAGVRRIEALAGDVAYQWLLKNSLENIHARQVGGLDPQVSVSEWIEAKKAEIKNLEKEIKKLQGGQINIEQLIQEATPMNENAKCVFADVQVEDREVLAQIADQIKNKIQKGIVVIIGQGENSHPIIVSVSKDMTSKYSAGTLLKEVATIMGGKGGGRPDFAQGAAPDRTQILKAKDKVLNLTQ